MILNLGERVRFQHPNRKRGLVVPAPGRLKHDYHSSQEFGPLELKFLVAELP